MTLTTREIFADLPAGEPGFISATVLPERGMMLLQARLRLPSGEVVDALQAPGPAEAGRRMQGPEDFAGNQSFAFGGAILAPFANRITGRLDVGSRRIEAQLGPCLARLPANWGGKAPGSRPYAMHGLILAAPGEVTAASPSTLKGWIGSGGFDGGWPGNLQLEVSWTLTNGALSLEVGATNQGDEPAPVGLGWHPWFVLPSGRRDQARLRLPAALRCEVHDYDAVLPTGRLLCVAGTAFDFSAADGAPLSGHLDDAFTDLAREDGQVVAEIIDPAADLRLSITSPSEAVKAVQVYAPVDQAMVVVEPQFNLADPFNDVWPPSTDTGMVWLHPGQSTSYVVQVRASALRNPSSA